MGERQFELTKIFIEKFLLALIVLCAGFIGNTILENYKAGLKLDNEFRIAHTNKLSETWASVDFYYIFAVDLMNRIQEDREDFVKNTTMNDDEKREFILEKYSADQTKMEKLRGNLLNSIIKNRFWIGESKFDKIKDLTNSATNMYNGFLIGDQELINQGVDAQNSELREDFLKIRKRIFDEL